MTWTTEAIIDDLEQCIVRVKEESQQPLFDSSFSYDLKYLNRTVYLIANWSKMEQNLQPHQFIFNLSDLMNNDDGNDDRNKLVVELVDLHGAAPSSLANVLHQVLKRLFSRISASWFYESACKDIEVVLSP